MKMYIAVCKECTDAGLYPLGTAELVEEEYRVEYMQRHNRETGHESFICTERGTDG